MYRLRAKRTLGSNPPADLLFGELAYSDTNKRLYIGRSDGSPCTFESDLSLSPITDGLAALETSQGAQDSAIALLATTASDQGDVISSLAPVATSGAYADLTGQPSLFSGAYADLTGQPSLFSGAYADLTGKPSLFSGAYADLTGRPTLAPVATSGAYVDLTGKPSLFSGAYADLTGRPTLAFTYDQQTEPVGPAAGQTWRERSSGGLVVGEWEWIASVSEWVNLTTYQIDSLVVVGSGTAGSTGLVGFSTRKRYIASSTIQGFYFSGNAINTNNFYVFTPQIAIFNNGPTFNLPNATLNGSNVDSTAFPNSVVNFGSLSVFRAPTGTPGQTRYVVSLKVRDVRA
ncbi:hypothetical protein C8255_26750 [filamentous cyanobacterium CCP3]|nr:hypothetical protein C8255_26750 [filamentous cyanobacterium CCP3]